MAIHKRKTKRVKISFDMTREEFIDYYNNCICMGVINKDASVTINRLCFKVTDNEIHLTGCCDYKKDGQYFLVDNNSLVQIVLPPFITHIDDGGLLNCINLTKISGDGIKYIGGACFIKCICLENVYFPNLKYIGFNAFSDCVKLKEINLLQCETIQNSAFKNCFSLKEINAPHLTNCLCGAFSYCYSLTNCYLDSIQYIDGGVFQNCIRLKKVYAPKMVFGVPNNKLLNDKTTTHLSFGGCISLSILQVRIFIGNFDLFERWGLGLHCDLIYEQFVEIKSKEV